MLLLNKNVASDTTTFEFIFMNAPISSTQEVFLTLQQVACKVELKSVENRFKVVIKLRIKRHGSSECIAPVKKQQRFRDEPSTSPLTRQGDSKTSKTKSKTGVRIFDNDEVNTPFISSFEREKRLFWNALADKLINTQSTVTGE